MDPNVQTVGHINIERYRCIAEGITTDEVIITNERIQHIQEHHPGHYEMISPFLRAVLEEPDYILEDVPNMGLLLKLVKDGDLRIQVVLRRHTPTDPDGFKNSIISAWHIRKKEFRRLLRNKNVLYKRE